MEAAMAKKSDTIGLRLRMPAGIHKLLVASAKRNARSLNHEVLWALAKYLGEDAQKHIEQWEVHRREAMHNVLRALARDPEGAARMIAAFDKAREG
jgi:hypothetical protein